MALVLLSAKLGRADETEEELFTTDLDLATPTNAAGAAGSPAAAPAAPRPAASASQPEPARDRADDSASLGYERGGLFGVGLAPAVKLGGSFSQVFSELGTSPAVQLELGYVLPALERSLEVFVGADYTQPTTERSDVVDTGGPGGISRLSEPMSYELTQQVFNVTLGAIYRVKLPVPFFRPYVAAGGRLYFMKTKVNGGTGSDVFGENREGAVSPGLYGALGGELHLGPGAVLLEAQLAYAGVDGFVMRDTNVGALNTALGYRLFL